MSILGLNAKDCQRRAANSENLRDMINDISEKVNAAVDKGLGSVSVDLFDFDMKNINSDEEITSARRNIIGALENDGFVVTISNVETRYITITISWHGISEQAERDLHEAEREIATQKFEKAYREARAKVVCELYDLKQRALELNPDYLNTIKDITRLEDEKHEIMFTGALGFVRDWKHACELRKRYARIRDDLGDAMRKYNAYRKSVSEIKIHPAVDIIHAREVLKNLILYGFNRK